MPLRVSPRITLDDDELVERFVRSPGPGGQNVNKTASAVELRFDVAASENLTARAKARLRRLAGRRMTDAGELVIQASRYRSQARNRSDARDRLVELLREADAPPPPKRIATKPTLGSKRRRLEAKLRRSAIKGGRGRVRDDE